MIDAPTPFVLRFPLGADNRAREYEIPAGAARSLVNLDVTAGGGLRCRNGARRVLTGDFHSFFVHPSLDFALVVADGALARWDGAGLTSLVAGIVGRVSCAVLNGEVYWSDGFRQGRVDAGGAASYWGLATPPRIVASAVVGHGLIAGTYQVTHTALYGDLESGAPECVAVEVPSGGGLSVTVPAGATFRVYVSAGDGSRSELRAVADVASGATFEFGSGLRGKRLESLGAVAPLPGQCVAHYKGRLWVASGAVVWFTSARSPHWLFPAEGYFQFESPVVALAVTEDGLYVATASRTYFLQGANPADMVQRVVASVGAASGSAFAGLAHDLFAGDGGFLGQQSAWIDAEGYLAIGKAGGVILRPHKPRYCAGGGIAGAVAQWDHDGLAQIVAAATVDGRHPPPNVAADVAVAETFAHGIVLGA